MKNKVRDFIFVIVTGTVFCLLVWKAANIVEQPGPASIGRGLLFLGILVVGIFIGFAFIGMFIGLIRSLGIIEPNPAVEWEKEKALIRLRHSGDWNAAKRWEQIRHTRDVAVLEDFIAKYGDTPYGGTARTFVARLKSEQERQVAGK